MRNRISMLQLRQGAAKPSPGQAKSQQRVPRKRVNSSPEREAWLQTIRDIAKMNGLPQGFYTLPKEVREKRRLDTELKEQINKMLTEESKPKWKKKFIPLSEKD